MDAVLITQCLARVKAQLMTAAVPRVLAFSIALLFLLLTLVLLSCSLQVSRCPLVLAFYRYPLKVVN